MAITLADIDDALTEKENETSSPRAVYDYLRSRGVGDTHAKGMLANIQQESNFNPFAIGDSGTSGGLFQHHADRFAGLKKATGGNLGDWKKQVDYALSEPDTERYLKDPFKTPEEATADFTRNWERPANAENEARKRIGHLPNIYASLDNPSNIATDATYDRPTLTVNDIDEVLAEKGNEDPGFLEKGGMLDKYALQGQIPVALGATGGLAGSFLGGAAGGIGAIPGAVAGSGLGYAGGGRLQKLARHAMGFDEAQGLGDSLAETGKDIISGVEQEMLGQGAGKVLGTAYKGFKSGGNKAIGAVARKLKDWNVPQDVFARNSGIADLPAKEGLDDVVDIRALSEEALKRNYPASIEKMKNLARAERGQIGSRIGETVESLPNIPEEEILANLKTSGNAYKLPAIEREAMEQEVAKELEGLKRFGIKNTSNTPDAGGLTSSAVEETSYPSGFLHQEKIAQGAASSRLAKDPTMKGSAKQVAAKKLADAYRATLESTQAKEAASLGAEIPKGGKLSDLYKQYNTTRLLEKAAKSYEKKSLKTNSIGDLYKEVLKRTGKPYVARKFAKSIYNAAKRGQPLPKQVEQTMDPKTLKSFVDYLLSSNILQNRRPLILQGE